MTRIAPMFVLSHAPERCIAKSTMVFTEDNRGEPKEEPLQFFPAMIILKLQSERTTTRYSNEHSENDISDGPADRPAGDGGWRHRRQARHGLRPGDGHGDEFRLLLVFRQDRP